MADAGSAWVLMDGGGVIYGCYVIEGLDLTRTLFDRHGSAKKIEFTLKLARVDDDEVEGENSANSGVAL
jgi:phage protein U